MALDVYVMPIWKFMAGDFQPPLAAIGVAPVIITPDAKIHRRLIAGSSSITRWKAKWATRRLRREIESEIGHSVWWNDKGEVAYARQAAGFESLRAFARWLDYRDIFATFEPAPQNNYYNHPVML